MAANRGKSAEDKLKKYLTERGTRTDFTWSRWPDAHAGSLQVALSDFIFMQKGKLYLLECKSTLHEYRLPHGNFDTGQVARMRMWQLAGATSFVMLYHEKLDAWRSRPIEYFNTREGGSWDLRSDSPTTLDKAFCIYADRSE